MRKPKDWGQSCPNTSCSHHGLLNRGNISAISTYMTASGKRRIFCCSECGTRFSETRETVFFDLRSPEEKVIMALKMLLVKVNFCKDREWMRKRVEFFQVFYNFARPHMSLRLVLPDSQQEPLGIITPKWIQQTPAMAAGLTDHVWSFRELLTVKFEPIYNQSTSG